MKIAFVAGSLSYGGAEKMLSFVANGFSERNNKVVILNLQEKVEQQQVLSDNIEVIRINKSRVRYVSKVLQIFSLIRAISCVKPDIIISFKFTPNYLATMLGILFHVPVIISERADPSHEHYKEGRARYYWGIINSANGGVFQTEMAKSYYEKHLREEGKVIPNPVFSKTAPQKELCSNHTIVSIGRLDNEQKRYDIMLNAFKLFRQKHPEYRLKIYGSGCDTAMIQQMITTMELEDSVTLEGYTSNPFAILTTNEIFIITSDYEGISNSLLEAMAAGIPVISTDSTPGGAAMLIKDHYNGILVPRRDIDAIANAMKDYAENKELRENCARNGQDVMKKYAPEKIMNEWDEYVQSIIERYHHRTKGKAQKGDKLN